MNKNNTTLLVLGITILLLIIFFVFFVFFKKDVTETVMGKDLNSENIFTFFGVGPNSQFGGNLRDELRNSLGSDAIETRTTINLEILYPGFIRRYFPDIYRLHQELNENARQRIEHNTIKLTYRYIRDRVNPFNYVELLFSNYSKKPLYFKIRAGNKAPDILEVLKSKYGEPEKIDWGKPEEFSLFWKNRDDILIFSKSLDKIGNPEFEIMIYYGGNIEELIKKERQEKEAREKQAREAIKGVF